MVMCKRYFLCLFLLVFLQAGLYAVDITSELVLSAFGTEKTAVMTDIYGTVFAKLVDKDKVSADLQYQFGDNRNMINAAFATFRLGKVDIIAGRQLMAWGSGYNINPTDIFNIKPVGAAFNPTYYKTGRDALTQSSRYTFSIGMACEVIGTSVVSISASARKYSRMRLSSRPTRSSSSSLRAR